MAWSTVIRHLIFPLGERVSRPGVVRNLQFLEQSQRWPLERLMELQREKLQRLVRHAYDNVPYYRGLFDQVGVRPADVTQLEHLARIPPLTKAEIRADALRLLATNVSPKRLVANSTSGSTGHKLEFWNDRNSLDWRTAIKVRNLRWVGCDIGDPVAELWGSHFDQTRVATLEGRLRQKFLNRLFLSSFDMSDATMKKHVAMLRRFRPEVLIGYPSSLVVLSEYLKGMDLHDGGPRSIVTSGESLTALQREIIEGAFGVSVYNRYGCREFGDIAHECSARQGLHVNAERVIVEFVPLGVDEHVHGDGRQLYRMLITDLDNWGMPFIRYDVGDLGCPDDSSPCVCGMTLPRIARLDGRSFDVIHAPNGRYVPGVFWTIVSREVPGIEAIQVAQTSDVEIRVRVVPGPAFDASSSISEFRRRILDEMGQQTRVEFELTDAIPLSAEGKRRFVVSVAHGADASHGH